MHKNEQEAYIAALEWHLEQGADEAMEEQAVTERFQKLKDVVEATVSRHEDISRQSEQERLAVGIRGAGDTGTQSDTAKAISRIAGSAELKQKAIDLVLQVTSLEELAQAIQSFDGLDVKKTATNFVFSDGHPKAKIMLVGEAPGADEDRMGKPFVGVSGQLLDKILACICLDRTEENSEKGVYITNILNWRPPGNRTPTPQEMEISKPFIEKHIALINPDYLILCGGVAAQTLLHSKDSISRLRGKAHDYKPQNIEGATSVKAVATYHPAYLLRTPSQKSKVWQDMLFLQQMRLSDQTR